MGFYSSYSLALSQRNGAKPMLFEINDATMMMALSRLAVVPLLITVMICFVLESTSVAQAR